MNNNIFRQKSLNNLSSPEKLDVLVQNVPAKGWLALLTLTIIVFITIIWSIFGSISTKVQGQGILLKTSGIGKIYSTTSGMLKKIYVRNGDIVKKGDLIATVSHPLEKTVIETKADALNKLEEEYERLLSRSINDLNLVFGTIHRGKEEIRSRISSLLAKKQNINMKISNQEKLRKKGLITYQSLLESKEILVKIQNEIKKAKNDLISKDIEAFGKKKAREDKLEEFKQNIISKKRNLNAMKKKLKFENEIKSTYDGKIFSIPVSEGTVIAIGTNIAEIEKTSGSNALEAIFFVSAMKGKMIKKDFLSQVSPLNVKKEEYGFIKSTVQYVSEFPATKEALMNILNNNILVESFLQEGPPIIVYAKLVKNSKTFSGYQWSSSKGPNIHITSGTLCMVQVTVKKQAPISLVIPIIQKNLGL